MVNLVYNLKSKTFSPAYSRDKFVGKVTTFSEEFIHNCIRLIVRPNHRSSTHWLNEMIPWIDFYFTCPLDVKNRPAYPLFNYVLEKGSTDKNMIWADEFISSLFVLVVREPYGVPKVTDSGTVVDKLKLLYQSIKSNCNSRMTKSSIKELVMDWYSDLK